MGKAGDLWDDSALINAFNDSVSKYKKMHGKKSEDNAADKGKVAAEESTDESQQVLLERDVNDMGNVMSSTKTDTVEVDIISTCLPESHGCQPILDSSNGAEIHNMDGDGHPSSGGVDDYNQLVSQYYELEEKRQQILEQLNQSGGGNYQYYYGDSNSGVPCFNPQETSVPACQFSNSGTFYSCCPYACQVSTVPCIPCQPCLGDCTINPCKDASVAYGPVHPILCENGITEAVNKATEKEKPSINATHLGDDATIEVISNLVLITSYPRTRLLKMDKVPATSKKRKTTPKDLPETSKDKDIAPMELQTAEPEGQIVAYKATTSQDAQPIVTDEPEEDLPALFDRQITRVNPNLLNALRKAQIIGYVRPMSERMLDVKYYTLQLSNLRTAVERTLAAALKSRYHEKGQFTGTRATKEIEMIVPLTVNAFMTALYAKMRTIHKQYGKYSSRYAAPASYSKDIELPLPLADAVSNFGVFESKCEPKCYIYVPVYPEGTCHEGRSTEDWESYKYECCIQIFKDLGIPCKNVDTRIKVGSAWWTYRMELVSGTVDATMIIPPLHYSDHSLSCALMFVLLDKGTIYPIIEYNKDDVSYGKKGRLLRHGMQVGAFLAICNLPDEDWNAGMKIASS